MYRHRTSTSRILVVLAPAHCLSIITTYWNRKPSTPGGTLPYRAPYYPEPIKMIHGTSFNVVWWWWWSSWWCCCCCSLPISETVPHLRLFCAVGCTDNVSVLNQTIMTHEWFFDAFIHYHMSARTHANARESARTSLPPSLMSHLRNIFVWAQQRRRWFHPELVCYQTTFFYIAGGSGGSAVDPG